MEQDFGYIIIATNDINNTNKYFSYDYTNGKCECWVSEFDNAFIFHKKEDAEKILSSDKFVKNNKTSDGIIYPPIMIWKGLELINHKTEGEIYISICNLKLIPVFKKKFIGEVKKPKGCIY